MTCTCSTSTRYREKVKTYGKRLLDKNPGYKIEGTRRARAKRARPSAASDPWPGLQNFAAMSDPEASAACDSLSRQVRAAMSADSCSHFQACQQSI